MKQIGIKQADGSFYPIMEDGSPVQKTLGLTTAKDNQTRVLVDLYRSETGTIDEAEYVTSLQIDNLIAHAKGSSEIKLNISLDENEKLSAELIDPETGATSSSDVTLISRTLEERLASTNFDVSMDTADVTVESEPAVVTEEEPEVADMPDFDIPDFESDTVSADETGDFSQIADASEETEDTEKIDEPAEENDNSFAEGALAGAVAGAAAGGLMAAALKKEKEEVDSVPETEAEPETAGFADTDFDLPDFDTEVTHKLSDETIAESDSGFDLPDFGAEETVAESESFETATEASSNDDFDLDLPDFESDNSETQTIESTSATESAFGDTNLDLPDFDLPENSGSENTSVADETTAESDSGFDLPDFGEETAVVENDSTDFDFPDFGTDPVDSAATTESSADDNIFGDDSFLDNFSDEQNDVPAPDSTAEMIKHSSALSFDDLYDKETMEGDSSVEEDEEVEKGVKIPTIICIVCAIICIIAVLLILFVIPSKCNILKKLSSAKEKTPVVEEIIEEPAPVEEIKAPEPEPEPEIEIVEAKEDEVVVVEEPAKVVPEPPKAPEVKPEDITYKIKWGDTLWDIADAYYKNPWKYKKIARYNGINNPDYIISGTYIKIPAK